MQRPMRLSGSFVRAVREPGRYGDGRGGYGLSLMVQPTASGQLSKSWAQRLRINGHPSNVGLGVYPIVTLERARELAFANMLAVRNGGDPRLDRMRRMAIPTFSEAVERVIELHRANWKDGGKTAKMWRSRLAAYAYPMLGELRVDAITASDVVGVLTPIWATKHETSRKLVQYMSAVLEWGIAQGYCATNVAQAATSAMPKRTGQVEHQRALPYADVPAALAKVRASDAYAVTKLAVEFLTLTVARSGEVRGARWTEIDGDTWTIPADRMKSKRAHRVPLSPAALAMLDRAEAYADSSGLVFPSVTGRTLSDSSLSKLFRELELGCVPHGMRSTFRDWAAEEGFDQTIAELCLAHVEGSATERAYRRSDLFDRRRVVMELWASAIA